jgi:hypothetical protein
VKSRRGTQNARTSATSYVKEELDPVPERVTRYVKEASGLRVPVTGGGSRNFLNEMARGSRGTMPGAGKKGK